MPSPPGVRGMAEAVLLSVDARTQSENPAPAPSEAAAEEDVPVAMFVAGQIDRLELLVKDVAGREGGELAVGDPAAGKDMGGFSFHGR